MLHFCSKTPSPLLFILKVIIITWTLFTADSTMGLCYFLRKTGSEIKSETGSESDTKPKPPSHDKNWVSLQIHTSPLRLLLFYFQFYLAYSCT